MENKYKISLNDQLKEIRHYLNIIESNNLDCDTNLMCKEHLLIKINCFKINCNTILKQTKNLDVISEIFDNFNDLLEKNKYLIKAISSIN